MKYRTERTRNFNETSGVGDETDLYTFEDGTRWKTVCGWYRNTQGNWRTDRMTTYRSDPTGGWTKSTLRALHRRLDKAEEEKP